MGASTQQSGIKASGSDFGDIQRKGKGSKMGSDDAKAFGLNTKATKMTVTNAKFELEKFDGSNSFGVWIV